MTEQRSGWRGDQNLLWGMVSLSVLVASGLMTCYGAVVVPQRLVTTYHQRAAQLAERLTQLDSLTPTVVLDLASELEVCWSRLDQIDPGRIPQLHELQLAERMLRFIEEAEDQFTDDAATWSARRERLVSKLQDRLRYATEQITSAGPPQVRAGYAIWLANRCLEKATVGSPEWNQAVDLLEAVLVPTEGETTDRQRRAVQLLLARMLIESAWATSPAENSWPYDDDLLGRAERILDTGEATDPVVNQLSLEILAQLDPTSALQLARQIENRRGGGDSTLFAPPSPQQDSPPSKSDSAKEPAGPDSFNPLRTVWEGMDRVSAVLGDWEAISRNLQRLVRQVPDSGTGQDASRVAVHRAGRQLARLLLSDVPDTVPGWYSAAPYFANAAVRMAPDSPEVASFLWFAGAAHAGQRSPVSDSLVESILLWPEGINRYLILALSHFQHNELEEAVAYLELGQRSDSRCAKALCFIAQWEMGWDESHVSAWNSLLGNLVERVPDNGLVWYTAGLAAWRSGDRDVAKQRLQRSMELVGPVSAIKEVLKQIETEEVDNEGRGA
ncbi:MAG: hypothetical protein KatS3mg111_3086 [Pirellulaceae bacterium]|nr:MAG: hypothetical protein KatS3mg111_3086 [Pirellulaceae bacterium]